MNQETPLVSVVIPTHGRPELLPRAIASALESTPCGLAQVVVVPNGSDDAWKVVAKQFESDIRVCWRPIRPANANAARNHGMRAATGTYLRFLDDDDYLLPAAAKQIASLETSGLDVCFSSVEVRTHSGKFIELRTPPENMANLSDLVISTGGITLPVAWLYRRSSLENVRWDESLDIAQDIAWLYALAVDKEHRYATVTEPAGVWVQHGGMRISRSMRKGSAAKIWARMLLDTCDTLATQHRLTAARRTLAAQRIWMIICGAYYTHPRWWRVLIDRALELDNDMRPNIFVYRLPLTRRLPPKLVLDATTPLLLIRRSWRRVLTRIGMRETALHD